MEDDYSDYDVQPPRFARLLMPSHAGGPEAVIRPSFIALDTLVDEYFDGAEALLTATS
jgi:hypothetical protein